jgi:murein L,D-transpeptidase YafK
MLVSSSLFVGVILCLAGLGAISVEDISTSDRAAGAIRRVEPGLRQNLAEAGLGFGAPIYIRIFKEEKKLEMWVWGSAAYKLFRTYDIHTYGYGTLGPKTVRGDGQAPEGFYFVTPRRLNPVSNYHLAFNIGYPNLYDRVHGRTGSAIMVHGDTVSIGCFAMTDPKIEEIYALAVAAFKDGQPFFRVHIFPFRMTDQNMERRRGAEWYAFWQNLKEGYDFFDENGNIPPNVQVRNGRYVFNRSE